MSKVFKREYDHLHEFQTVIHQQDLTPDELREKYTLLLKSYQSLLQEAVKITKIGDISQKKLFDVNEDLITQKNLLYLASITDALTTIYNRSHLMEVFTSEFAKSKRYQHIFSCILMDIDNFKTINDNYGHQMGDSILIRSAAIISKELREVDIFGRYGGEEFMVILPNTDAQGAAQVAEKIRLKIAQTEFHVQGHSLSITLSLGISDNLISKPHSVDDYLYKIDTALYQAKHKNKNNCVIYQASDQSTFSHSRT